MDDIFKDFNLLTAKYKHVDDTSIDVDVLVPKGLPKGEHPIIARFHGGAFTSGSSLHPAFFPRWVLGLAINQGAIIVTPNYRLLPESDAPDIMEDLDDLWIWLKSSLQGLLATSGSPDCKADLGRILTVGESAGGYLSVQFALDHASEGVRACIAECPSLDIRAVAAGGNPDSANQIKKERKAKDNSVKPVISDPTLSRFHMINQLVEDGVFLDYFPNIERVHPFDRVRNGWKMPATFMIHGINDTIVPHDHSVRFAEEVRRQDPSAKVHVELQPGEHLMDIPLDLDHPWLAKGVKLVTEAWL
ncbi:alpha/beta-hydrolase [Corynespora cassiicola Philippines]|uniref:Alpha/beta-hydrolase n=1 Tax=Corynespora cassiicola Philippines TaxID=1448308 RepID=A0A2T2NSC7_CORCC|nr:alpha/beta-hydrolase [Corynespora cassiicola Philippines]